MATLHLHLGGVVLCMRGRSVDAASEDPATDLVNRLRAALAAQGHVTHDDADPGDGHWVTINGAHVFVNGQGVITKGPAHLMGTPASSHQHAKLPQVQGGTKAKVHGLLSAGHSFTFGELKEVLGNPPDKALTNALAELKNPKWAGPKGALDIVKGPDGKYKVMPKGPAEATQGAIPGPTAAPEGVAAPALVEAVPGYPIPDPIGAKAPEGAEDPDALEWEPGMPEEMKAHATVPAPLTKEDADAQYKGALHAALEGIGDHVDSKQAALAFKQAKADAMATWAGHVKGGKHEAKKVTEVHKADTKLVEAVQVELLDKGKISPEKADELLAKWKEDTKLEKLGKLDAPAEPKHDPATTAPPSKVAPPAQPPQPTATSAPPAAEQPHFPKVTSYVPDHHVGITAADIGSGSEFEQGLKALKSKLSAASLGAEANKDHIANRLNDRLKASPAFQHIKKAMAHLPDKGIASLESKLIACWAGSSGGKNPTSNAAQLAIRDAFGMGHGDVSYDALEVVKKHGGDEDGVFASSLQHMSIPDSPANRKAWKAALHDFALAQYANTQERFKEMGITHLHLARGMSVSGVKKPDEVDLKLQPASSFSTNWDTAKTFSGGDGMYYVKVPVEQVLGSYLTGYGCTGEHEVVVLAHPKTAAVEQPAGAVTGLTDAMQHLDQHLPGAGGGKKAPAMPKPKGPKSIGGIKLNGFVPQPIPEKPNNVKSAAATAAVKAAKKLDLAGVEAALASVPANKLASKKYIPMLVEHVKSQLAALEAHNAGVEAMMAASKPAPKKMAMHGTTPVKPQAPAPTAPGEYETFYPATVAKAKEHVASNNLEGLHELAASVANVSHQYEPDDVGVKYVQALSAYHKAQAAPAAPHKVVGYMPGVPAHHQAHPHFDPVAYANWQAQGKTEAQIGKTLAAIKFAAKKKAEAAAAKA